MALKCDKRFEISAIFGRQKSLQNVGTSGYFLACTIFRTSICRREVHIWKTSTYNPKNRKYSWPCCGSLNTVMWRLSATMKINVSLQIGEIMSNNKIMQFCYFYWNTNAKKADEKMTLIHNGKCHDCDIAWCFWKNAWWDTIWSLSALAGRRKRKRRK